VEQVLAGITIRDVMLRLKPENGKSRKHARAEKLLREMIPEGTQSINKRMRSETIAKEH